MTENPSKLDLYSIYVTTIISNETRRQQASAIYLSLISAGLALIGSIKSINIYYVIFPAIAISVIWLLTIIYFRALAQAKFKVIGEIEKDWEIKPFNFEWKYFKSQKRGAFFRVSLTYLEMSIPIITFICSIAYILFDVIGCK
jgi:signal transduction histidine kinase